MPSWRRQGQLYLLYISFIGSVYIVWNEFGTKPQEAKVASLEAGPTYQDIYLEGLWKTTSAENQDSCSLGRGFSAAYPGNMSLSTLIAFDSTILLRSKFCRGIVPSRRSSRNRVVGPAGARVSTCYLIPTAESAFDYWPGKLTGCDYIIRRKLLICECACSHCRCDYRQAATMGGVSQQNLVICDSKYTTLDYTFIAPCNVQNDLSIRYVRHLLW